MRKKWLRLMRIATLALLFAGTASAQTTATIIGVVTDASTGKPVTGAVIIATSPALQGEQTAVTDATGSYQFRLLPPGNYKLAVQLDGYKPAERSDITLRTDKTIRANLAVVPEAVQMEEQVVRTGAAPAVNVGSAEAGAVISKEFISSVPVARGYEAVAATAPTAKIDTYGVSFAGAQSPENQYIIDGLNTTDPAFATRGGNSQTAPPAALRTNFTEQLDVKTGNFGAEYGRATGGIVNVILKSGSNEYHGSVFSNFTPNMLVQPNGQVIGSAGEAIGVKSRPSEGSYAVDFGAEVGGPILKDRLWFYGGFAPVIQQDAYDRFLRANVMPDAQGNCPAGSSPKGSVHGAKGQCVSDSTGQYLQNDIAGTDQTLKATRQNYQWVGKLTYLLDENNNFTVTGWGNPGARTALGTSFFTGQNLGYNAPTNSTATTDDNQTSVFGHYGGKFLNKKLIGEAQIGWFRTTQTPVDKSTSFNGTTFSQFGTPALEWVTPLNIATFEKNASDACTSAAECPVYGYTTGGRGIILNYTTDRYAGRASASYLFDALGAHNVKAGIDLERLDYSVSSKYGGGGYWVYQPKGSPSGTPVFSLFRGYGVINGSRAGPGGTPGLDIADIDSAAGVGPVRVVSANKSQTDSFAYYLQDSWQFGFLPNVTLNYGIRLETQSMKNLTYSAVSTGFNIDNNWSPRVQGIWDFTGNGRGKIAGSWGRYYYALPLDAGNRAFGSEIQLRYLLDPASCGFGGVSGAATFDPRTLATVPTNGGVAGACQVVARPGSNNDIRQTGGDTTPADSKLQGQYVDQFGAQAEYEILSDLSLGVEWQARRQGNVIEDMSSNDGGTYFIGNPGVDRNIYLPDGSFAGNSRNVTTVDPQTGKNVNIQFPVPERSYDGLTFRATKVFSKNWLAQASYTYSVLRGNYPGPFRPEDNQLDPGITAEYDLASLMANKKGFLPGDQTHAIKLFGAYTYPINSRFAVTGSGAYNGVSGTPVNALGAHPDYGPGQAFIIQRGQGGRTPWTNTVDVGGALQYVIRPPYAVNFRVDIFNVFNSQTAQQFDQNYTFDTVAPISGSDCKSRNSAGRSNPVAALQADCPELQYLKTVDGRPVTVNPNWGKPALTTTAFQVPISLRLSLAITF